MDMWMLHKHGHGHEHGSVHSCVYKGVWAHALSGGRGRTAVTVSEKTASFKKNGEFQKNGELKKTASFKKMASFKKNGEFQKKNGEFQKKTGEFQKRTASFCYNLTPSTPLYRLRVGATGTQGGSHWWGPLAHLLSVGPPFFLFFPTRLDREIACDFSTTRRGLACRHTP